MRAKRRINESLDMLLYKALRELLLEPIAEQLRGLLPKRREARQCTVVLHELNDSDDAVTVLARSLEALAEETTKLGKGCTA